MTALDQLHAYLRPRLTGWKDRLPATLMHTAYAGMAAGVLWPLVAAMRGGELDVIVAFMGLLGNLGANLVSDQIKQWKDEASAAQAVDTAPADLRAQLDTVLTELKAPQLAAAALPEADRAWFERTLKENLQTLGNRTTYEQAGVLNVFLQAGAAITHSTLVAGNQTITHITNNYFGSEPPNLDLAPKVHAYLHWLSDRFGTITLPGIERQGQQVVQLPLDTVYVPLQATTYAQNQKKDISLRDLLGQGQRLVVTGGPGSGKTTVLLYIARTLALALHRGDTALAREQLGLTGDLPLPIFLTLSGFARHRRHAPEAGDPSARTLAGYISRHLIEKQSGLDLPPDFFQRLLKTGQSVLLLLDGLDEVPNEDERAQVREAIQELLTGREALRVVVTCRTAAYRGRTALPGAVEVAVQPLQDEHIGALITQAYASLHPDNPAQQQAKADDLITGITRLEAERRQRLGNKAERLVTSPLLVRMLLIVHIRDRRLPEQRAELYLKAVEAMLKPDYAPEERVVSEVGALVGGSMEAHREMVQALAFAMHQRGDKQGREIDEAGLKQALPATPETARQLIALTRTRGTLLEERDGLYRFVHLGFQEFLVARYLAEVVRGEGGVRAIADFLESDKRILDSWWREVVLLTVGYLALTAQGNARMLLERLGVDNSHAQADVRLAASELAMLAVLENFAQGTEQAVTLRTNLAQAAAALISQPERHAGSSPVRRAATGRVLSVLGDPRPGVGVIDKPVPLRVSATPHIMRLWGDRPEHVGLPDITWVAVPGVPGFRLQTDEGDKGVYDIPPFYIAQYPVTGAQFQAFVVADDGFANPRWWAGLAADESHRRAPRPAEWPYANHPREGVSWWDAVAFGRWLSARLGWPELPADIELAGLPTFTGVRLPTEWEWQWAACPRQPQTAYPWGDDITPDHANYDKAQIGRTSAVGVFPRGATPGGAQDLSGNMWEWCLNEYDQPGNIALKGHKSRVLRGGAWYNQSIYARVVFRNGGGPDLRGSDTGFRVVRAPVGLGS